MILGSTLQNASLGQGSTKRKCDELDSLVLPRRRIKTSSVPTTETGNVVCTNHVDVSHKTIDVKHIERHEKHSKTTLDHALRRNGLMLRIIEMTPASAALQSVSLDTMIVDTFARRENQHHAVAPTICETSQ